jgi:RNA polymerase sigma-70 factor (ECF subfamily)
VQGQPAGDGDRSSPEAFAAFYREHLPTVYGYVLHLSGGDRALAEDLTQETFFALVRELRRGHVERADPRWLLTVARSRFIDHVRRVVRAERGLRLLTATASEEVSDVPTGDEVLAAMSRVDPLHRVVLMMRYVEGLSVPSIADAIGRSVGATNSLLARARTQLRSTQEATS